jgi:hypothetical protein
MNDSTYVETIHAPVARRRTYLDTHKGAIRRFYVQLEYNRRSSGVEDDWVDIARFDHQPENERGHDIRKEGLHMDVCHPKEKDRKVTDFPNVELASAPEFCESYFDQNYDRICLRYAEWESNKPTELLNLLTSP